MCRVAQLLFTLACAKYSKFVLGRRVGCARSPFHTLAVLGLSLAMPHGRYTLIASYAAYVVIVVGMEAAK